MSGFLDEMARSSSGRAAHAKSREPFADLERRAKATPPGPRLQLSPHGFDVIAELKLRSPAQGRLAEADENWLTRVSEYARGGAAAVSVLTEPSRFDGSLEHLRQAAAALEPLKITAMRKIPGGASAASCAACPGVTWRGLGANTKPMASTLASAAALTASAPVMPHILIHMPRSVAI